ncbi:hypothetical protein BC826DRAFT_1005998 [Russula brevipes]|nr:hypothetical protein BC826DRAFT_1005998 [Russula brevipes]
MWISNIPRRTSSGSMWIVTWAILGWSTVLPGTAKKTYIDPNYQALPWDVPNAL